MIKHLRRLLLLQGRHIKNGARTWGSLLFTRPCPLGLKKPRAFMDPSKACLNRCASKTQSSPNHSTSKRTVAQTAAPHVRARILISLPCLLLIGSTHFLTLPLLASSAEPAVDTDFPFLTACIQAPFPANNNALKGIAIKVGNNAAIVFDTDLLRVSAGWIGPEHPENYVRKDRKELATSFPDWAGKYLILKGVTFDDDHGNWPAISGDQKIGTSPIPGWAGADGSFKDTR